MANHQNACRVERKNYSVIADSIQNVFENLIKNLINRLDGKVTKYRAPL